MMDNGGIQMSQEALMELMVDAAKTALHFSPRKPHKVYRGNREAIRHKNALDMEKAGISNEKKNIFNVSILCQCD